MHRTEDLLRGTPGAAMKGPQVVNRTRGHNPLQIVYRQPLLLLHTPLKSFMINYTIHRNH